MAAPPAMPEARAPLELLAIKTRGVLVRRRVRRAHDYNLVHHLLDRQGAARALAASATRTEARSTAAETGAARALAALATRTEARSTAAETGAAARLCEVGMVACLAKRPAEPGCTCTRQHPAQRISDWRAASCDNSTSPQGTAPTDAMPQSRPSRAPPAGDGRALVQVSTSLQAARCCAGF